MPTLLHGAVESALFFLLVGRGWKAYWEVTVRMSQDSAPVPDVIATRKPMTQPYPAEPVEICVEVLSPDDRLKEAIEKGKRYLAWGISYVWIANPVERTAWALTPESPDGIWIHPDGSLTAGKDTEIPLPELFAQVDKLL